MATSAATSAVTPAASSTVIFGDSVNAVVASPASSRWPGPVNPVTYQDTGPDYAIEGPPGGSWVLSDVAPGDMPGGITEGGIQDTSWMTGTDGPEVDWDSAAGRPFAPSQAVIPDLHGQDTGAVFQAQYVTPATVGQITRHTGTGQTYNREYAFDPVQGGLVPAPNARQDYDQTQTWDPAPGDGGGWAPWDPGYSERPILNNVAYQATPVTDSGMYGVAGAIPDRAPMNDYTAQSYEAPPDVIVNQPAGPPTSNVGGWLLG